MTARTIPLSQTSPTEYCTWEHMRSRCNSPTNDAYVYYGGRGITVCERWNSFSNFLADMGPKPSPKHSIDRINNDGNYEPGNCRWATSREQQRNKRNSRFITFNGITKTSREWVDEILASGVTGMSLPGVEYRVNKWKDLSLILEPPKARRARLRVTSSCGVCGSSFERDGWEVRVGRVKYCSRKCANSINNRTPERFRK